VKALRILVMAQVIGIVILALAGPVAAAGSDPFKGSWSAIDVDGSLLTLSFSGSGSTRGVTLLDDRATCAGGAPLTATGVGTIAGTLVSGTLTSDCGSEPFSFTSNTTTSTLSDGTLTYYRGSRGPDAFNGVWYATDWDGSALRLSLDGTGLSRDVSFKDDGATVCGPVVGGEGIDWTGTGPGTIGSTSGLGRFMEVTLMGGCAGAAHDTAVSVTYEYHVDTNTLSDSNGVTWSRKG